VMLVLFAHGVSGPWATWLNPGALGVRNFFVLSGYLITGILIDYSEKYRRVRTMAAQFYWRRILRLSPPLLIAIALSAALGIQRMRDLWWVHALYLSNFQVASSGSFKSAGHFWSLATEEQFYLVWFPLMVLTSNRGRLIVVISALICAMLYRLGVFVPGATKLFPEYFFLPFASIDTLAIGALLALAQRNAGLSWLFNLFRSWPLMIGALILFAIGNVGLPAHIGEQFWQPASGVFGCCLVRFALDEALDPRLRWLSWAPVRHVGKISYGLYIYHFFVPDALRLVMPFPKEGLARRLMGIPVIAISFVLAELSWWLVERPILALKQRPLPAIGYLGEADRGPRNAPVAA
jgi:peptidoglycan/LPS O-acetylase OafA/YrhL